MNGISIHIDEVDMRRRDVMNLATELIKLLIQEEAPSESQETAARTKRGPILSDRKASWVEAERRMSIAAQRFLIALREKGSLTEEEAQISAGRNERSFRGVLVSITRQADKAGSVRPFAKEGEKWIWKGERDE